MAFKSDLAMQSMVTNLRAKNCGERMRPWRTKVDLECYKPCNLHDYFDRPNLIHADPRVSGTTICHNAVVAR
jgi:hypothetical protein